MEREVNRPIEPEDIESTAVETPAVVPDNVEPLPDYMRWVEDEKLECTTKDGIFIFEDLPYDKILSVKKRCIRPIRTAQGPSEKFDVDAFELGLMSESMYENGTDKKLGELAIRKLRGSTVLKLRTAIYKIYDMPSFLSG